ncbi:LysR family transcriptional regulator [Pseudoduganella namucuonensis]|uniref:Transcriptional regulator, LysR family n=1 Tax=Pseudoduganella namucuonensis TaxID=1035707 RepID=A0A1I7I721_9BURK|nr:LysR family transcriptional regulator [Pseudoduganella namucuonensis]SFU68684.1 transcriptional regulator, LysR family [Pseudoduganella namucuonensis]
MDRLQSMRVFAKVVEQGSFARAGMALEMSNAVVTRHVADLEQHLGTRLLNRTTRKLSLTETGTGYLDRVRQILSDIDDADAAASATACKPSGTLRIYCHPNFGQTQLAPLLPRFAAEFPDVVLDVTLADKTVDLVEEGYDLGFFIGVQKFDGSMIARQLASSSVIVCASPDYVRRRGAPAHPRDLTEHDCLNHAFEQVRHTWNMQCGGKEVRVPIVSRMVSNNVEILRQAAIAGMGVVLRSTYTLQDDIALGRLVRLLPDHCTGKLTVLMVYPSRKLLSAKVRAFVDFMTATYPDPEADPWLSAL